MANKKHKQYRNNVFNEFVITRSRKIVKYILNKLLSLRSRIDKTIINIYSVFNYLPYHKGRYAKIINGYKKLKQIKVVNFDDNYSFKDWLNDNG